MPERVNVPDPTFVNPPVPLTTPANVVVKVSPVVSVAAPNVTDAVLGPDKDAIVLSKLARFITPLTVKSEFGDKAPRAPAVRFAVGVIVVEPE